MKMERRVCWQSIIRIIKTYISIMFLVGVGVISFAQDKLVLVNGDTLHGYFVKYDEYFAHWYTEKNSRFILHKISKSQINELVMDSLLIIPRNYINDTFPRRVVKRNNKHIPVYKSGTMVFDICIDRSGEMYDVVYNEEESLMDDADIIQKTTIQIWGYVFEPNPNGPFTECSKLNIIIDLSFSKRKRNK